jgi:hypothetical protein
MIRKLVADRSKKTLDERVLYIILIYYPRRLTGASKALNQDTQLDAAGIVIKKIKGRMECASRILN